MKCAKHRIVVVGSLNVDRIAQVESLPLPGQTVSASRLLQRFGGKGANQAVAAARQGASVAMIGCVGSDGAGASYRSHLDREGIDLTGLTTIFKTLSGSAMIAVDRNGENQIIVCPGANDLMKPSHIRQHENLIATAKVVLLQWEVPPAVVLETLRLASKHRVPVAMNPSPLSDSFPWGKYPIHTLIVNEGEARAIFGEKIAAPREIPCEAMAKRSIERLVITRGANSTLGFHHAGQLDIPTMPVTPVDTVGAGDTFAGTFAACLADDMDFATSLRHANFASALATLKPGAQEAIPKRIQVIRALAAANHEIQTH